MSLFSPPPPELVRRYDVAGPRYTSYPTAPTWRTDFTADDLAERLRAAAADPSAPLSLYAHIPFCQEMCSYCGCNVVITKDAGKADRYLEHLGRELAIIAAHLGGRRGLSQIHLGGGTPTFLSEAQLEALHRAITAHFRVLPGAEIAIEIDPVVTTRGQLKLLRELGWNRLSMGVQDFDPQVQQAVCRVQSPEETAALLQYARELGFSGVNFDLIYGLPHQTPRSWASTLEKVLGMRPDRLAIYSFAYVPALRPHQKRLPLAALPMGQAKLDLLMQAGQLLCDAGYRPIGMDHFALPEDELCRAQERRALWRNFQGYTVKAAADVVACGITGISDVQGSFSQSCRPLPRYYGAIGEGRLPTERGLRLSADDQRRRAIITQLMCNFYVDLGRGGATELAPELERLRPLEADGLVRIDGDAVEVLPPGRHFVRNVAMAFDAYLQDEGRKGAFSRTV